MIEFRVAVASDVGLVREINEDRVVVGTWILGPMNVDIGVTTCPPGPMVAAVLDGMGGHAFGEIAAITAAEVVASLGEEIAGARTIESLVEEANAAIYERMTQIPQLAGMGSTIAGVAIVGSDALIFHVGDSRVYLVADGYLVQLSKDHAAPNGALLRSLGGRASPEKVEVDISIERASDGTRFIIATDGLFGHLEIEELEGALVVSRDQTARNLLELALSRGGPDNVSVVVADVMETHRTAGDAR